MWPPCSVVASSPVERNPSLWGPHPCAGHSPGTALLPAEHPIGEGLYPLPFFWNCGLLGERGGTEPTPYNLSSDLPSR